MTEENEKFLSRWSRLKQQTRETPASPAPATPNPRATEASPELPPVDELGMDSDYRGFFHPKVNEDLRRTALKKLFSDPHFNVMDGLDTYIDDYSKSDPLPAALLAQLKQAQKIIEWANDKGDKQDEKGARATEGAAAEASEAPPAGRDETPNEIPVLSGQGDDAVLATDLSTPVGAGAAAPGGEAVPAGANGSASGKSRNLEREA